MDKIKKNVKPGSKMEDPFQKMPNELLEKIFSSLPFKWVKVARLVCRRWFRVLNQDGIILNAILSNETISNVKYFTKPHLASLRVKKLNQDILRIHGPRTIPPPTISKLIIANEIHFIDLVKIFQYYTCSNINELVFASFSLSGIWVENISTILSSLKQWKHLKILKLWAARKYNKNLNENEFEKHTWAISEVLGIISLPTLEQLSLNLDSGTEVPFYQRQNLYCYFSNNSFDQIYSQLVRFLQRHQKYNKLKELELKYLGPDRICGIAYPSELWINTIVQLDSIKLELRDFNFNYINELLNTQNKLKQLEIQYTRPFVTGKFLTFNNRSLDSITVFGKRNQLLLVTSSSTVYPSLKSLTVGFYNNKNFKQFLSRIPLSISSSETAFPQLVNFNLIDTHFLTDTYQRTHYGDDNNVKHEEPIEDALTILICILNCFSTLKQVAFTVRGDSKHTSDINNAANCILEKVKHLKTIIITSQRKYYNLNSNIMKGIKTSSGHCYERSVRIYISPSHTYKF